MAGPPYGPLYIGLKHALRFLLRQTSCRETVISPIPRKHAFNLTSQFDARHTMPTLALNEFYCLHFGDEINPAGEAGSVYAAAFANGENG